MIAFPSILGNIWYGLERDTVSSYNFVLWDVYIVQSSGIVQCKQFTSLYALRRHTMATVKGTVKQSNTGHNSFEVVREGYVAVYTANGIIWRKVAQPKQSVIVKVIKAIFG